MLHHREVIMFRPLYGKVVLVVLLSFFSCLFMWNCSGDDDDDDNDGQSEIILEDFITIDALMANLQDLEDIASQNNGHRAAGSVGYDQSVAYIRSTLANTNFIIQEQSFNIPYYEETVTPELEMIEPDEISYTWATDFLTLTYSGSGNVTAEIGFVDPVIPPGNSTDGCEETDFDGIDLQGKIAVIQRGGCTFQKKAQNAENHGALAVLIFNEGGQGETGVFSGTMSSSSQVTIPTLGTSYTLGEELYNLVNDSQTVILRVMVSTESGTRATSNVIAETPGGNENNVILLGAHLDSVPAGPGINDNGSGSAALLELAKQIAQSGYVPQNKIKFAWWAAEEIGLIGSFHYIEDLAQNDPENFNKLGMNLNFDMIGSPNFVRGINDTDQSDINSGMNSTPAGCGEIEAAFKTYFDSESLVTIPVGFGGTDDLGFLYYGIPSCGLFTGASGVKSQAQADLFGGTAGQAYDPCYHTPCDTTINVNQDVYEYNAKAMAYVTRFFGDKTGPLFNESSAQMRKNGPNQEEDLQSLLKKHHHYQQLER